jgi:hypothetical protein
MVDDGRADHHIESERIVACLDVLVGLRRLVCLRGLMGIAVSL